MSAGKFERLVTIPTGNWTATLTESEGGGGTTVTLTAANAYYWSSATLLTSGIADALTSASFNGNTYTASLSAGEGGTGLLTISHDASPNTFTITSFQQAGASNNAWRSLMGFSADLSPTAVSHTGDLQVEGLWLGEGVHNSKFGSGDWGADHSDMRFTVGNSGDVTVVGGANSYLEQSILYTGVSRARARIASESTTNESFQRFWRNDIRGDKGYCAQPGGPIRWYPDSDDNATFSTGKIAGMEKFDPEHFRPNFVGLWNILIPRWIDQG